MNNEELSNAIQKWQKKDPENRAVFSILMDKKGYTTSSVMGVSKDILASLCATIHQDPQLGVLMRMAMKALTLQSEKNVAFAVLADIENGNISTFIKGEESDILALLVMEMAKDSNFKKLLFKAIEVYKLVPIQKIIEKYEQDEQHS